MSKFFKITLLTLLILGLPIVVFGADDPYGIETTAKVSNLPQEVAGANSTFAIVGKIVGVGLSLVGIVFFGLTLFAGIYWMTARGDSSRVDKAKDTLESAIIGLIIVMAAYAIVNFVFTNLSIQEPNANTSAASTN